MANVIETPTPAVQKATRRSGLTRMQAREELTAYLLITPWVLGFLIFTVGALIFSLGLSFFKTDLLSSAKFVGLNNYQQLLFEDKLFWQAVKVTTLYTLGVVPLQILLSLSVAILLNQRIYGIGFWRTIFYLPSVVSGVAVALVWMWFFQPDVGLFNALLAMVGIQGPRWLFSEEWALPSIMLMSIWNIGPSMIIFLAGLQGTPVDLYEAAQIDGASTWQQFTSITLPMLSPQILFNTVLGVIGSYQVFTASFVTTEGGPNNATMTLVLYLYREGFLTARFGYASAIAWVLFAIIMVFTLFTFRSTRDAVFYEAQTR